MFKGSLAGKDHRNLRIGIIACLDRFKVALRASGLYDPRYSLCDPYANAVAEGDARGRAHVRAGGYPAEELHPTMPGGREVPQAVERHQMNDVW